MNPTAVLAILSRARDLVDDSMSVQKLQILLAVAAAGDAGIDQGSLQQRTKQARSTCSKNVHDLTTVTARKEAGPGLVVVEQDAMNLRSNTVRLTQRGRSVVSQLFGKPS
jgi:DNA-binding MarR family transcriptional regulator